jgi:hypothetical protein
MEAVQAAGTFLAILVALYVGAGRAWMRRPRLSLEFDPEDHTDARVVGMSNGRLGAFARLRVENQGKTTAEDVELLVWNTTGPDGSAGRVADMALFVSRSRPFTTRVNVAPGAARHIDFVHHVEGSELMVIDVLPAPADKGHKLPPGQYRAEIVLTARNAQASRYQVPFEWDGGFAPGWDRENVRVGPIRKLK